MESCFGVRILSNYFHWRATHFTGVAMFRFTSLFSCTTTITINAMKTLLITLIALLIVTGFTQGICATNPTRVQLEQGFLHPAKRYYPETWFHLNGKNISKAGLTADLEAIHYSGMQGIQLFNKKGPAYPNVEQISILSPEWEDMIAHVADETERLGLKLTMQNCPGWSMAGGPWMSAEQSQRELVEHEFHFFGGQRINQKLDLDPKYQSKDRNYQDIQVLAFNTPKDNDKVDLTPSTYQSNNNTIPWPSVFDKQQRVAYDPKARKIHPEEPYHSYQKFGINPVDGEATWVIVAYDEPITLRSIQLPPIRPSIINRKYPNTNSQIRVEARVQKQGGAATWQEVALLALPSTHWYDLDYGVTLSLPTTTSSAFRLTFLQDPAFFSYIKLNSRSYLNNFESKAAKSSRNLMANQTQQISNDAVVDSEQIINLSAHLDPSGILKWQAPTGNWTVVRFGHVNMLRTNKPAEPEATGWEASKMDKQAIEFHLREGMMGNLMRQGGPLHGHDIHGMLIDSWESHVPTWTMHSQRYFDEFKQRRGYDMKPYLPVTMGYVVDSVETSEKFLRDVRHTNDDLYVENFFQHFRTVAHDMGTQVYTEGATGEVLPGDPLRYYGVSDYPMTEFWYPKAPSNQKEAKPIYAAASAYHLYDKPLLAAEAATQLRVDWSEHPHTINYLINENFSKGINHLVFHTFSHTPQMDVVPGSSFGGRIGFPMLRTQTWWQHTPTWMTALARSQYLLQQGEFVADVLWYLGDEFERHPFDTHPFPKGYKFDYLNQELLLEKTTVKNGQLYVKGAGNYKVIWLRDSQRLMLSTAKKIKQLVEQGAVVLGNKPRTSPSLMDGPEALAQLAKIADTLWGDVSKGQRQVGKGKVYWGYDLKQVLDKESIVADVVVPAGADVRWLHRRIGNPENELDLYYVTNQHSHAIDVNLQFRQSQGQPSIWNVDSGSSYDAKIWTRGGNADQTITNVVLNMPSHSSQFVVFDKQASTTAQYQTLRLGKDTQLSATRDWVQHHHTAVASPAELVSDQWRFTQAGKYQLQTTDGKTKNLNVSLHTQMIDNRWSLQFESGWDVPSALNISKLIPLTAHSNPAVQHYSGTVTYTTVFDYQPPVQSGETWLDLGQVHDIAKVKINGQLVGTRLAAPFAFNVSKYLLKGNNQLQVEVTNTWRNQLIFDGTRPENQKKTWTTFPPSADNATLTPSGLIGPVKLTRTQLQ